MADQVAKVEYTLRELEQQHPEARRLTEKLRKRIEPILKEVGPPALVGPLDAWSDAFLDAARCDLRAVTALADTEGDHAATIAMLLQMVFEKIAKAYLAKTDPDAFKAHHRNHKVALLFTQMIKRDKSRRLLPKVGPKSAQVILWVEALTSAHPAVTTDGPHLEYPWGREDRVYTPSNDLAIVNVIRDPNSLAAPHLTRFASALISTAFP